MAAFDTSNIVMTALAGEGKDALIGNWVKAREKGIINGINYGSSGEIERLKIPAIEQVLEQGFIPIFPCIGWNNTGTAYNISSTSLAAELAIRLSAQKLFFVTSDMVISHIPEASVLQNEALPNTPIPAMDLDEVQTYIKILEKQINTASSNVLNITTHDMDENANKLTLLNIADMACLKGVTRVHIINGSLDGALPCEIFSGLGSGTMIYKNNYGGIHSMTQNEIPDVLNLMRPFIEKGILLERNAQVLKDQLDDFIVYEMDGGIKACAALHIYEDQQAEIAAIAVDETSFNLGTGPKLVNYLINKAKKLDSTDLFVLTTQTADWFLKLGFTESTIDSLPKKRRQQWTPNRGSKVLRIKL